LERKWSQERAKPEQGVVEKESTTGRESEMEKKEGKRKKKSWVRDGYRHRDTLSPPTRICTFFL